MPATPPELPRDWRPLRRVTPLSLVDAGLGIFGLRRPQIVGRDAERDALWAALREVRDRSSAAVVETVRICLSLAVARFSPVPARSRLRAPVFC